MASSAACRVDQQGWIVGYKALILRNLQTTNTSSYAVTIMYIIILTMDFFYVAKLQTGRDVT